MNCHKGLFWVTCMQADSVATAALPTQKVGVDKAGLGSVSLIAQFWLGMENLES